MGRTALVLGAGGFIGGHLFKRPKGEGFWVRGVDRKRNEFAETPADDFVTGDLRNPSVVADLFDRHFDEVYQLAADMGRKDSPFNHVSRSVEEPVGRVIRRLAVATGCSARWWSHFRAGADARVAARGQAGGRGHEPARRRTQTSGDGSGYRRDALVELEGRGALQQWISGGIVLGAGGRPQRRAAGGCDAGWRGRLTEVDEDVAPRRAVGDEGDDAHRTAAVGTHQRRRWPSSAIM